MYACICFFFFFNDTAPTEIYTLSLHDALPIWPRFRRECRAGLELWRPDSDSRGRGVLNLGRCLSGGVRLTLLQLLRKPACRPRREERMRSFLRTALVCLATVIGVCVWLAAGASAASPEGMRLYVFSSGWLNIDKSGLQTGATGKISVPVAFFLIKHPKGNVLFETGKNDKIITDPTYWGPLATALTPGRSPDVAIDVQLDKVGVKPSDINTCSSGICTSIMPATSASSPMRQSFISGMRSSMRSGRSPALAAATSRATSPCCATA